MPDNTSIEIQLRRISEKVWNITDTVYQDIEIMMNAGLFNGMSAEEIAQTLTQYLKDPQILSLEQIDKLVQDSQITNLQAQKLQESFYRKLPQGVYRSSIANAFRLARNEINIGYHKRDFDNRQKLPFVIGIEVFLSGQHSIRMPSGDMCDHLKGKYPKDFVFTGWHVQCLCGSTSILANKTQLRAFFRDEKTNFNYVDNIPKNAQNWIDTNAERINKAKSKPYFIQDNKIKT